MYFGQDKVTLEKVHINELDDEKILLFPIENQVLVMCNERVSYLKTVVDKNNVKPYKLRIGKVDSNFAHSFNNLFTDKYYPLNEGPVGYSTEKQLLVFNRNYEVENMWANEDEIKLAIFFSEWNGEKWEESYPYEHNSRDYNLAHPALSSDGKLLIFSSTGSMKSSNYDLYYSRYAKGVWSVPKIITGVNSTNNEMFPSIINNRVYFSRPNLENESQDLDIWSFTFDDSMRVSNIYRLDAPINSSADDFGYYPDTEKDLVYITSNRDGKDQIYRATRNLRNLENCEQQKKINYCYQIEETNLFDTGDLPLKYYWDVGDGTFLDGTSVQHCYDTIGKYEAKLRVKDTITGEEYASISKITINNRPKTVPRIVRTSQNELRIDYRYSALKFDSYMWQFKGENLEELASIQIGAGNRDSIALGFYRNDTLVYCVKDYLKNLSVKDEAIVSNSKTISDTLGSGIFTVEILNSDVKIDLSSELFDEIDYDIKMSYSKKTDSYLYTVGQNEELDELYYLYREMMELGFDSKVIEIEIENEVLSIRKGNNEQLTVLFASGSHDLTPYYKTKVKNFILNLPSHEYMIVEGFTDALGNVDYNKKLSKMRAQSVVDEINAAGYKGKDVLDLGSGAIGDEDDPKSQRKVNRKVVVRLIH